jgi:hypothetical protein
LSNGGFFSGIQPRDTSAKSTWIFHQQPLEVNDFSVSLQEVEIEKCCFDLKFTDTVSPYSLIGEKGKN